MNRNSPIYRSIQFLALFSILIYVLFASFNTTAESNSIIASIYMNFNLIFLILGVSFSLLWVILYFYSTSPDNEVELSPSTEKIIINTESAEALETSLNSLFVSLPVKPLDLHQHQKQRYIGFNTTLGITMIIIPPILYFFLFLSFTLNLIRLEVEFVLSGSVLFLFLVSFVFSYFFDRRYYSILNLTYHETRYLRSIRSAFSLTTASPIFFWDYLE